jgi:hypothetical protein
MPKLRRLVGLAPLLVILSAMIAAGCDGSSLTFHANICNEADWHANECYGHFESRALLTSTDVGCEGVTECSARCIAATSCAQYRDLFEGHPTTKSGLLQTCLHGCQGWP